jgi:hypothetical protein
MFTWLLALFCNGSASSVPGDDCKAIGCGSGQDCPGKVLMKASFLKHNIFHLDAVSLSRGEAQRSALERQRGRREMLRVLRGQFPIKPLSPIVPMPLKQGEKRRMRTIDVFCYPKSRRLRQTLAKDLIQRKS